ncbi:hypothetical protein [Noviluteimonas gilva]|uniref:Uncharacterized protein n=1 Tax=Noviluteimonas gilva TaxID=2682097 RepID=A0A7C9HWJ8_9GAMM|nr:hypothetical protein [Lysobacter gilvus]MUV15278.1 hypothetical protein [Lysobacter gilvus]
MRLDARSFIAMGLLVLGFGTTGCATPAELAVQASPSSNYPCDVFNFNFCFRKPYGAVVELRSGPDFDIYRVVDGESGRALWSVYVGTAPERTRQDVGLFAVQSNGVGISAGTYPTEAGARGLELRLAYPKGLFVHVFGVETEPGKIALVETLPSFRLCSKSGLTSIECKSSPMLDGDAQQILRDSIKGQAASNTGGDLAVTSPCELIANPEMNADTRVHIKSLARPAAHSVILLYDEACKDAVVVLDVPSSLHGTPGVEKMMKVVWEGYPAPRAGNTVIELYGVYRWKKNDVPSRYIVAERVVDATGLAPDASRLFP